MSAMQTKQQARPSKLFLGGLTRHTTTKDLRDHFMKYGRVLDCVAMRQPDGRPRGFGYVTLDSPAAADRCLAEPQVIDGRIIDMKRAVPGTSDDGTPKGSNSTRSARGSRVFGSTPSTRSGTPSERGAGVSPFGFGPWDTPGAAGGYLGHMAPYSPSHWGAAAPWVPEFSVPSPKAMAADLFEVLSPASALCRTPGTQPQQQFSGGGGAVLESLGLLTTPGGSSSAPGGSSSAASAAAAAAGGSTPTTLFAMTPSAPRSALSLSQGGVEDSTPQKVELPTPFTHRSVLGDITNLSATSPEAPLPSPLGSVQNQQFPRGGTPVYAGKENASTGLFLPASAVTPRKRHSPSGFPIFDEPLCIPELPEEEAEEEEQAAAAVANTMAARKIIMPPPGLSPPRHIRGTSPAFLSTMAPGLA